MSPDGGERGTVEPVQRRPGRPRHETPSPGFIKRRTEIIDVAANVFQAKGYDAGSLDDVAAALNLRKASLYYYVRSKAELLYLVFDRAITVALESLEQPIHSSMPPYDRLEHLLSHQIRLVASDTSLFSVFFDQRPHLDNSYELEIQSKERRYLHLFISAVEEAGAAGLIAPVDARYGAQLLLGMANWTYKWFEVDRDNASDVAKTAVSLILGSR